MERDSTMFRIRHKHEHMHEPVARQLVGPDRRWEGPPVGGSLVDGPPRQVVTWRCWCSDVYTQLMDGQPTLAELIGLGADAQALRRLRDTLRDAGVPLDPSQEWYRREQDWQLPPAGVATDVQAFDAATSQPGHEGEITSGLVDVPDWPDHLPPPAGGGGIVPHLPVQRATSITGWMCAACELPIEQLADTGVWETNGDHKAVCSGTSPAPWDRHQ